MDRTEYSVLVRDGVLTLHTDADGPWALRHARDAFRPVTLAYIRNYRPELSEAAEKLVREGAKEGPPSAIFG
jgi:hypothetical protein